MSKTFQELWQDYKKERNKLIVLIAQDLGVMKVLDRIQKGWRRRGDSDCL